MIDIDSIGFEKYSYRNNNEYFVICPFHDDHNPSANFNVENGLFHCFTCGENSNAYNLAKLLGGNVVGSFTKHQKNEAEDILRRQQLFQQSLIEYGNASAEMSSYLAFRQVPDYLQKSLQIRHNKSKVFFPHIVNGQIVGMTMRMLFETKRKYLHMGTIPPVYPFHIIESIDFSNPVFIGEGVFAAIRGLQSGIQAFAMLGVSRFKNVLSALPNDNLYFIFDDDQAGNFAKITARGLGLKVVNIPFEADERQTKDWQKLAANIDKFSDNDFVAAISSISAKEQETILKRIKKIRSSL